ncbi:hypothetical protein QGN32_15600 [Mycolicibacterium sp. ND9-15]|uniref:DUF6197 family protein n=1 Tax=Mycolicibacterium sp. ND9-15 TaxID=3042320 RepID=UPI002DDC4A7C|nr:hypothetical protein [Mycolicibacterium sp. ND9-15]WSE54907.1 hypothetical protein QGN32_15600 [Mycolicibacterium sp. ND9-15]
MTTNSRLAQRIKNDRQVIQDALTLIEVENGWTQGTYCRDAGGREVHPAAGAPGEWVRVSAHYVGKGGYVVRTESGATPCSYCLGGALRAAAGFWDVAQPYDELDQVERLEYLLLRLANSLAAASWPSLQAYNDDPHTTRADAVLVLKRAVAHLDAQEQMQL